MGRPVIVAWEAGGGQAPRQPGQVRKEAAVTSPAWVGVQPPTLRLPRRRDERVGRRLSGARAQIPAEHLRRVDRPGSDGAHPGQCDIHRPHRPRLHPHRRARSRQDHHRPHHRPRAQLHRTRRQGRPDGRSLRGVRELQGHRRRPACRRAGNGRGLAHRHRRHPRIDRRRSLQAGFGALQDLHHR